ncbi:hypothetical protein DL98DRAFT_189424 [Cadophora sp. DSE1049]|nr:hypothetical protein DL98DRAFT_189424 [Cadophora sp. DSE1049]
MLPGESRGQFGDGTQGEEMAREIDYSEVFEGMSDMGFSDMSEIGDGEEDYHEYEDDDSDEARSNEEEGYFFTGGPSSQVRERRRRRGVVRWGDGGRKEKKEKGNGKLLRGKRCGGKSREARGHGR